MSPFLTVRSYLYITIYYIYHHISYYVDIRNILSNFKRNEKHVFWWFSTGRYIWHFLWVRYGGYSGYGTVGTVGTVRGVRWVRYGGYGGCVYLHPPYRTHRTHRTVPPHPPYRTHCTHCTVPNVPTVPYPLYPPYRTTVPNVPHPSPYHHFWGPYPPTEHYSWNLIRNIVIITSYFVYHTYICIVIALPDVGPISFPAWRKVFWRRFRRRRCSFRRLKPVAVPSCHRISGGSGFSSSLVLPEKHPKTPKDVVMKEHPLEQPTGRKHPPQGHQGPRRWLRLWSSSS